MTTERYETTDHETAVEIEWTGETAEYRVFSRGTTNPIYRGPSLAAAESASGLDRDEWTGLLMSDNLMDV